MHIIMQWLANAINAIVVYFDPTHNNFSRVLTTTWIFMCNEQCSYNIIALALPAFLCIEGSIFMMFTTARGGYSAVYSSLLKFSKVWDNVLPCFACALYALGLLMLPLGSRRIFSLTIMILVLLSVSFFIPSVKWYLEMFIDTSTLPVGGLHRYEAMFDYGKKAWDYGCAIVIIVKVVAYAYQIWKRLNRADRSPTAQHAKEGHEAK